MTELQVTTTGTKLKEDKIENAINFDANQTYVRFMESFNRKFNIGGAVKDSESRHIQNSREARKNLFGQATRFEKHLSTMSDDEKLKMDGV